MGLKTFRTFLNEALIEVDREDINKIFAPLKDPLKALTRVWDRNYERFLAAPIGPNKSAIARTIAREFNEVLQQYQPVFSSPIKSFDSGQLKSETAKQAHAVNPITIHVWLVAPKHLGNLYAPADKVIHICLPNSVVEAMLHRLETVPNSQLPMLKNEVSELKHKTTIRHELTHWIDDSTHNFYITKGLHTVKALSKSGEEDKAKKVFKKSLAHGEEDIYLAPVEINAMVNQIAEYQRRIGKKKYDNLSWHDIVVAIPSLSIYNRAYGAYWRKKMFDRLSREGLIGKNFQKEF